MTGYPQHPFNLIYFANLGRLGLFLHIFRPIETDCEELHHSGICWRHSLVYLWMLM